jgi:hypothetical protein
VAGGPAEREARVRATRDTTDMRGVARTLVVIPAHAQPAQHMAGQYPGPSLNLSLPERPHGGALPNGRTGGRFPV